MDMPRWPLARVRVRVRVGLFDEPFLQTYKQTALLTVIKEPSLENEGISEATEVKTPTTFIILETLTLTLTLTLT